MAQLGQYGAWLDSLGSLRKASSEPPSMRARKNLDRGRSLLREGDSEAAMLAFQAALLHVLQSDTPEDRAVRSVASDELLGLIRGEL